MKVESENGKMIRDEERKDRNKEEKNIYEDPFYYDAPFYWEGMSAEQYRQEQLYLNENVDIFIDGTYVPLWKQKLIRDRVDDRSKDDTDA